MSYLYFLLILLLELLVSSKSSELFYLNLVFALHGLSITSLEMLFQMKDYYEYYSSFTPKSQGIVVVTWFSAMIFFILFATGTVHLDTTVYSTVKIAIFMEVTVVLMILCKYASKIYYMDFQGEEKMENWTLALEGIGSFLWTAGIVYKSYYGTSNFMVEELAKTSIAYITAIFTVARQTC